VSAGSHQERVTNPSADASSLAGRVALVTGATSGLGFETARALARRGAHVVLGARTRERGEAAADLLRADHQAAVLSVAVADLSTRDGVCSLARDVLAAHARVDVLVNNAGTVRASRHETPDGMEWTFAVNHLAPFLLTRLLLPALGEQGRVVIVTSDAHRDVVLDLDDLQSLREYDAIVAYRRSKLANVLFARALARRAGIAVVAVAPGIVATEIVREAPSPLRTAWAARGRSAIDGARPIVDAACALAGAGLPARYVSEGREMEPSIDACNEELAERLWDLSATLTRTPASPTGLGADPASWPWAVRE
jgi:NAD(P)-dependent dehydrogenase (short-subunit alcohol dehydrogenase family)